VVPFGFLLSFHSKLATVTVSLAVSNTNVTDRQTPSHRTTAVMTAALMHNIVRQNIDNNYSQHHNCNSPYQIIKKIAPIADTKRVPQRIRLNPVKW